MRQRRQSDPAADAQAHEAELAMFRSRLADVSYRLGLHEASVVRELGSAQVDALRSVRGVVALPRRLWRLVLRLHHGRERQSLDSQALARIVDQAISRYADAGFAAADAFVCEQFLSMPERAHVYAGLAAGTLSVSGRDAARYGEIALSFDHDCSLILRVALLKYEAGQLSLPVELLARLPVDHPTTPAEQRAIATLRGYARLSMRPLAVPRKAAASAPVKEPAKVVLVWDPGKLPVFGERERCVRLSRGLASEGVQCLIAIPGGRAGDAFARALAAKDADGCVEVTRINAALDLLAPDEWIKVAAEELAQIARRHGATLFHVAGTYRLALPAIIAARAAGSTVVYERLEFPEYGGEQRTADWRLSELFQLEQSLEASASMHADLVVVATRKQAEEIRRRAGVDHVTVQQAPLPVPVASCFSPDDARRTQGAGDDRPIVGVIHEGHGYEGLEDLLAVFSMGSSEPPTRTLLILASTRLPDAVRRQLEALPANVARIADELDEAALAAHLTACHCVVFPWRATSESDLAISSGLLQAMSAGVPVLVSSCFAFSEIAMDGVNARMFAAGNSEALARCLEDIFVQRQTAVQMAGAAKASVSHEHSWPVYLNQVLSCYRDAAGEEPSNEPVDTPANLLRRSARRPRLRVAAIMDEFTHSCFAAECDLVQLTPEDWHAQLTELEPDFLLVESAWQGHNGEWEKQIPQASNTLRKLVAHCRRKGIRTAFWNKEDPVHFSLFLDTARLFDTVFTTDVDRIKAYRDRLGHDRVYLLPFACQPRVHNPIERYDRLDAFCFAGSYYAKYPERRRDFDQLMDAARALRRVDIFDRNHGKEDPGLRFPAAYQQLVIGSLPVSEIDRAYKGYRFGITVNTVKQSQSMFARRAFELLACNTITISNFSRGLRLLLGDLVVSGDSARVVTQLLGTRIRDEGAARRFRLAGLRKVMDEHTYAHRLAYLAGKVLGGKIRIEPLRVVLICVVTSQEEADQAVALFDQQSARGKELVLVVGGHALPATPGRSDVIVLTRYQASLIDPAERWRDAYLTVLDLGDHYCANYLKDLQLAAGYAPTEAVGKVAHYGMESGRPRLRGDGAQYRIHERKWPLRCSLVASSALAATSLEELLKPDAGPVLWGLASDEFNYCADGAGFDHAMEVDSTLNIDEGVGMDGLWAIAESPDGESGGADPCTQPGYRGEALLRLFAPAAHGDGLLQVSHSIDGVAVESRLSPSQHAYAYATRLFKPGELAGDGLVRFHLVTGSGLYVNAVVVYLDEARHKISHAIVSADTNQALPVPPGTSWIRFGLRVLGPGATTIKALVKGSVAPPMDHIIGRGDAVLITKDYPRYDDLYRYGFVHRRILAYAESGRRTDVFRFSNSPLQFDEYEGVDVVAGQAEHLRLLLEGGKPRTILVHAMDPQMWEHIKPLLETRRVVIWVHGAEIQPWFRRLANLGEDLTARDLARRNSHRRLAMWRDVLLHPHPNLRIVFVSRYLEQEALGDLGVQLPKGQVHVIPNYVDGNLFRYERKDSSMRARILSVRPFASRVYANDLLVEAILLLSKEPFFDELTFTIVGDGSLFDDTVAPLRQFRNVKLQKQFLSQTEIADLHRRHGVFLVPSRMDSQGVSRDEAMASGLVPVTNRVAAIPEFTDESCAILADPEDASGLAAGIARLWRQPELFERMSAAAGERVRLISGRACTIEKELALIDGGLPLRARFHEPGASPRQRMAVYGDVNLNVTDGSAIWAASLAEVLAGMPEVSVTLYLKAVIKHTHIIAPLLSIPGLRIVEPVDRALAPSDALDAIEHDDAIAPYDAIVLRGLDLCEQAAMRTALRGRLWVYLTDVPQTLDKATAEISARVARIVDAAGFVLCQTPQFRDHMERWIPKAMGKTCLLPPMVPSVAAPVRDVRDGVLNVVYAGKFAPLWGIREMLDAVAGLRARGLAVALHVYGDKVHNPADDPAFREEVTRRLGGDDGVLWHGAVERSRLLGELSRMDVGWAWRHASLESGTHELSTKLLEYASAGVPPIMVRNPVNESVFGDAYPLYANSPEEAADLLGGLASNPALRMAAVTAAIDASRRFDFASIRHFIRAQGLVHNEGSQASSGQHNPWVST